MTYNLLKFENEFLYYKCLIQHKYDRKRNTGR